MKDNTQDKERNKQQKSSSSSNTQDLKQREYRDNQGNIHHHTHTSQDMKGKEKKAA